MFIIIEGTDASGKSTLVEEIKLLVCNLDTGNPVHVFHKSKPEELTRRWALKDYVLSVENIAHPDSLIIADRWHWGEATYAPLKRPDSDSDGYGLLGAAGWRWTEMFLMSRGAVLFWLYQPLDVVTKRLESRGDDYIKSNELSALIDLHEKTSAKSAVFTGKLQPSPDNMNELTAVADIIVDMAVQKEDSVQHLTDMPFYIGAPKPKTLLIGDQRNQNRWYGKATMLPFIPVDGNSGDFLLGALEDSFWPTAGILNGSELSPEILHSSWVKLGSPTTIALGRNAEAICKKAGIELIAVTSHPQHVKRFYARQQQEYGAAISALARGEAPTNRSDNWAKEKSWVLA